MCLLALLAPLRVVGQSRCTPLGVSAKFVAPSDSGHMLVTNVSNVATKTAFCHVNCLTGLHLNGTNVSALRNVAFNIATYVPCMLASSVFSPRLVKRIGRQEVQR